MAVPINIHVPLDLTIHRHNGADDDDCEVTFGETSATLRPNKVAAWLKAQLRDVLPGRIKDLTGFDPDEVI